MEVSVKISQLFKDQSKFNNLFYEKGMTEKEKEEITKGLALALHSEVSSLVSSLNFKDHKINRKPVDLNNMLYESVDILRYLVSILNLWEISPESLISGLEDKDLFLNVSHRIGQNKWCGEPVVIVDVDDVLAEFRCAFTSWMKLKHGILVNKDSTEYYTTSEVKRAGFNPEDVFFEFIESRGFRDIEVCKDMLKLLNKLKMEGYWIHLLTARPEENPIVKYDTFFWIEKNKIPYDRVDFSPEKYRWITQSEYFDSGRIVCAIDDSPKHASEIAKHGIPVISPSKSYNQELLGKENIRVFESLLDSFDHIKKITN
jgi:hypothetical protein